MAKRVAKGRRIKFQLVGGPFHGKTVELYSAGTLEFTVNGFTGRYDDKGHWQEKNNHG